MLYVILETIVQANHPTVPNILVFPSNHLAGAGNKIQRQPSYNMQGSHSLAYKIFQDFSRTHKTFFQDSVVAQQC